MSKRPRLKDIALEAAVGTATVERVLNARGNVSPSTAKRVLVAARKLGSSRTTPPLYHASVRVEVILVRPDTPFFSRLNLGFKKHAELIDKTIILHRSFLEEDSTDALARRLDEVSKNRSGLIIVVQNNARVEASLRMLENRKVPVVLLVSDVRYRAEATYVGIDNESAGRTAGFFMRRMLAARRGEVVALCHGAGYMNHRQRIAGFSEYFRDRDQPIRFDACLFTKDSDELAYALLDRLLASRSDIVGLYLAGGGNAGVHQALSKHRSPGDIIYIGHELSPATRTSLETGIMMLTIDQEPELQAKRAIEILECEIGLRNGRPDRSPIPFRIVTRENLGP